MKKLLAVWAVKILTIAGKIMGKKSTSGPGEIALKICPDLIKRLAGNVGKEIIVTCGTNGKTTTNNLLYTALTKGGYEVVCNNLGANMIGGIATAFASKCNIFGKFTADYACLEIDEASATKVFDHIKPDVMVITNMFRDQLDRYGETEQTMELLNNAIEKAEGVTLVLNGDDPLTTAFGENRNAKFFGISEKVLSNEDNSSEGRFCIKCGSPMKYNFVHYSQLGDFYCEDCGNKRPEIDYEAKEIDLSESLKFQINGKHIDLNYRGFYNIYNVLAVYSVMEIIGVDTKHFNGLMSDYKPQIGRMEEFDLGKPFILNLAKNPAGFNQAIETVLQDKRKKDVIIAINDKPGDGIDVSWLWDVDFEKIGEAELNKLYTTGIRVYDLALRFKYSGIEPDMVTEDMEKAIINAMETDAEVCYVLVNYTALFGTQKILKAMRKEKENE
ncbi:MAG: Mur ligase family protein [Clostridia bacterium]|nr:Mur ligase family protein [Clostridia bacterium]